tara:strand:+ start:123 stop:845 length:723 start_codon:yes stop_codon:yes gene_type:complete
MKANYSIKTNPDKNELEFLKKWLSVEYKKYGTGFFCNWNIIKKSFSENRLIIFQEDKSPIGFIVWRKSKIYVDIDIMEIHPEKRKLGLGKIFYHILQNFFLDQEFKAFKLFCDPSESEIFWRKMGFIDFPETGYVQHDLTLYKPIIDIAKCRSDLDIITKLELWNTEPHQSKFTKPMWTWDLHSNTTEFEKPIFSPCNPNWMIRLTIDGHVIKEGKVKYFQLKDQILFDPFIYIDKPNFA